MTDDPQDRRPEPRISDADRERVLEQLRAHTAEGRLTLDELSERASAVVAARTRSELDPPVADLPSAPATPGEAGRPGATRWTVAVMGSESRRGRWRVARRTTVVAVMGGCLLDLRGAELDGPEVTVTALAVMGGVDIVVPEGIDVELTGLPIMGGKDLRMGDAPPIPGAPLVRVRALALMGGVVVRSRPGPLPRPAAG